MAFVFFKVDKNSTQTQIREMQSAVNQRENSTLGSESAGSFYSRFIPVGYSLKWCFLYFIKTKNRI